MRTDVEDGPFQSESGRVPFITFEEKFARLHRFKEVGDRAVEATVEERRGERRRQIEWARSHPEASVYLNELTDYEDEQVAAIEEEFPEFLYAGVTALIFTLFEVLLGDLVEEAVAMGGQTQELQPTDVPHTSGTSIFCVERAGWKILEKRHRRALNNLRSVRNKLIHTLGRDIPEEVHRRLSDLLESPDDQRLIIDGRFVGGLLKRSVRLFSCSKARSRHASRRNPPRGAFRIIRWPRTATPHQWRCLGGYRGLPLGEGPRRVPYHGD